MSKYNTQLQAFAICLLVIELVVLLMFGFFVRNETDLSTTHLDSYYPWFQDVNVMILVGFGFLMTFIRSKGWSALGFTFFINAVIFQLYVLWEGFWHKVFHNGFGTLEIKMDITTLIKCSFAVASVLISFGAIIGRVSPLELLILGCIEVVGYSLNEAIIFNGPISVYDVGGSMNIHTFGAYCGLACSTVIGMRMKLGDKLAVPSYISCIFGMIGTLFLWLFWPSFNSAIFPPELPFQRMICITNTVFSLTGSCIAAFCLSILVRKKLNMDDILNATLAGGVAIGSSASLITNPAGALAVGLIAGGISTLGYAKLTEKLARWHIYDTCGINNLHGMPGLLGGLASAVFISAYNLTPLSIGNAQVDFSSSAFAWQGGIQVAGTFISLGIGIGTGLVAGGVLYSVYKIENSDFFDDEHFWEMETGNGEDAK